MDISKKPSLGKSSPISTKELAKQFLDTQIKKKEFIIDSKDISNRRVREFLQSGDYLYSPCKGLYIIKDHTQPEKKVTEHNYFQLVEKLSHGTIISGDMALNYHLGKNQKVEEIEAYTSNKNSTMSFEGERTYTVRYQASSRFRDVEKADINGAKILIETPASYLINHFDNDMLRNDDYVTLLQTTNFMLGDIKTFLDKGANITALSSMALWYKEQGNTRNFSLIKTAITQSGKAFKYPPSMHQDDIESFSSFSFQNYDNEVGQVTNPKIARFNALIKNLDTQCGNYLRKLDLSKVKMKGLDLIMDGIDKNIVHDSYHSLTIENYKVTHDDIALLASPNINEDGVQQLENKLAIKGYLDSYKITVQQIRVDYGSDGKINEQFAFDINSALFKHYAIARSFKQVQEYRKENVEITGAKHLPPEKTMIHEYMDSYFTYINGLPSETNAEKIKKAVMTHYFLVYIHPFSDGNGRTARFLMNHSLGSSKLDWLTILSDDRDAYIASLQQASDNDNIIPFTEFIVDKLEG